MTNRKSQCTIYSNLILRGHNNTRGPTILDLGLVWLVLSYTIGMFTYLKTCRHPGYEHISMFQDII